MRAAFALLSLLAANAGAQALAPGSFDELSKQARQAYEANRPGDAVALYGRALKLNPRWPEGWWALGMLEYQRDRYPECRDAMVKLTALDAEAPAGWALRGLCEYRTRQFDPALDHLKRAHMLAPGGGELRKHADYHLALLLTRQGAFELSFEILVKVARMAKDDPDMMFACGLPALRMAVLPGEVPQADRDVVLMAGRAFWDLATRPPAESKADFEALVAKYPKYPNVHYFYATYLAVHQPEAAMSEFQRELRIAPDHAPARVQIALLHLLHGQVDEALAYAREAVAISPDSVGTRLAYGRALMDAEKPETALAEFVRAKQLDPANAAIRMYLVSAYRALGRKEEMAGEQKEHERLKAEQKNWP